MISRGGEDLTGSSLVLDLSLLLLFAGYFLNNCCRSQLLLIYSNGAGACSTRPGAGAVPADTRPPELERLRGRLPHLQGPQGRRRQSHLQSHQTGGTCTTPRAYVLCPIALCGWLNSATWRRCTYTPTAQLCGRIVYSVSTLSYHLSSLQLCVIINNYIYTYSKG